ncbi:MAG TPA: hypothetical protein PLB02_09240 [Thermoanaerobaculia bacterium]|nr:hypothetical protein [Thermoanaerobaculia bacterium]HQR67565.1 hypothetical protein [Thermoanaerobaculia bacterium]
MKRVAAGLVVFLLAAGSAVAQAPAPAAPAWRPFSEFAFLLGSWSGTATSGGRIGGRVVRFAMELNGTLLVERGSTIYPAGDGKPEETTEELGFFTYDREKRRYVATYFFSTGVFGAWDVEIPADGVLRMTAPALGNFEAGARGRLVFTRRADGGLDTALDIALPGKDFVGFQSSSLKKK